MEEKKMRVRPTVTQMRQLEKDLESAREACRQQLVVITNQEEQIAELKRKNKTLEASNQLLNEETERLRESNSNLFTSGVRKTQKILKLKSRKFWARVFNHDSDED